MYVFFHGFHAPYFEARGTVGFFARHSGAHFFRRRLIQKVAEFFVKLRFRLFLAKQSAHSRSKICPYPHSTLLAPTLLRVLCVMFSRRVILLRMTAMPSCRELSTIAASCLSRRHSSRSRLQNPRNSRNLPFPLFGFAFQFQLASARQRIIFRAPVIHRSPPLAFHQPSPLQPPKRRKKRTGIHFEHAVAKLLDPLRNAPPVQRFERQSL